MQSDADALGPPRPQFRITSLVENREDDNQVFLYEEEDAIGKTLREGAARHFSDYGIGQRAPGDRNEDLIDRLDELKAQAGRLFLVPVLRFCKISLRFGPDQQRITHPRRRSFALTSDHGCPALGSR